MKFFKLSTLLVMMLVSFLAEAEDTLSDKAILGKAQFSVCLACHNTALKPAKAPPMFGVQMRYKRQHDSQDAFVDAIVSFVNKPKEEVALMKRPIKKMGLMPALPLGDEVLGNIAAYIYEASFEPPCDHWENARESGGNNGHRRHVQENYDKFCQ